MCAAITRICGLLALALSCGATTASADAGLLLGEPYGRFGAFSPTGHAAVYLSRVCAESPTRLRRCDSHERGVVISRYHRVGGVDWVAVPLLPYLYAVDADADVPDAADRTTVARLREAYRRAQLRTVAPDRPDGTAPAGNWTQLAGAAYDRQLLAFVFETTEADDNRLIDELNARANVERFNLLVRNCADFARDLLQAYVPGAVRNNVIADLGVTTPKQVARALVSRQVHDRSFGITAVVIRQVPGSRRQSGRARGVLEGLVKTKKYAIPLALAQPLLPVGMAVGYLATGRFDPHAHVQESIGVSQLDRLSRAPSAPGVP